MPKNLKTIKEDKNWRNKKTQNIKTLEIEKNENLIRKAENWKLWWYHIVKPKGKKPFIRSNPNKKKIDNLDPKIKKKK